MTGETVGTGEAVALAAVPALAPLYARALAGSLRTGRSRRVLSVDALPDTRLVARGLRADPDHLSDYQHLLHEPAGDALPAGFVHVLAFPVAMALMVRPDFPLPVLGMVHVANRVEQRRPVLLGEGLDVAVRARDLRAHRTGVVVDVVVEVGVAGEPVWEGTSTYLSRGVRLTRPAPGAEARSIRAQPVASQPAEPDDDRGVLAHRPFSPPTPTGQWSLSADVGRRYAAVSGDRNPIHLSRVAARAFGFPQPIAHGMYTAARALADVGPARRGEAFVWAVDFAKPVLLPATPTVRVAPVWTPADVGGRVVSGTVFGLAAWDARRGSPYLTGTVTRLV